jgi:hypothetical protein
MLTEDMMKKIAFGLFLLSLAGCVPTTSTIDYASENSISLRYNAYDSTPTLTSEARDKAIQHCAKYGKYANYQGGNAVNSLTAGEIHRFACEAKKTDDTAILAKQNERRNQQTLVLIQ